MTKEQQIIEEHKQRKLFYINQIKRYETQCENDTSSSTNPEYAKDYHYLARGRIELADLLDDDDDDQSDSKNRLREQAIDALTIAIKLTNAEDNDYHQMWNYHLLARAKADLNDFDSALSYINKAIGFTSNNLHEHAQLWNYHLRGRIYLELKLYDSAKSDIEISKNTDMLEFHTNQLEQRLKQESN